MAVVTWLSLTFGLPPNYDLPNIAQLPAAQNVGVRHEANQPDNWRQTVALYDDDTNTILLSEAWTAKSPADISVIVHEMVHHMQNQAALQFECPAAREKLAYTAQEAWLNLYGLSLSSAFKIDAMTLKLSTQCMPY